MNELDTLNEMARAAADREQEGDPSGCPPVTDVADVSSDSADPGTVARIENHAQTCALCRARLDSFRRVWAREPVTEIEPPIAGSLLEVAVRDPRKRPEPAGSPPHHVEPPTDRSGQPELSYASLGLTNLARSKYPADRERLLDRLRPWLPSLFPDLELDEPRLAAFLQTLPGRPSLTGEQRFRDVLPVWLAEFLGRPVGTMVINRSTVGRAAVLRTVGTTKEAESELTQKVRMFVLEKQPCDPDDLEHLDFPADIRSNPAFEPYTDDLFAESRQEWQKGLDLFDLQAA
jgi:hypothetical protein